MGARYECEVLRKRASTFLETSKHLSSKGAYDLTCFNAEQAAQLYCKAALLEMTGNYPRTHSVLELLNILSEPGYPKIAEFVSAKREALRLVDTAYITARYFAMTFTIEDAERMISTAEEVMRIVDEVRKTTKKG